MFIFGRSTSELPGFAQKSTTYAQFPFTALNGGLNQSRLDIVVIDVPQTDDALIFKPLRWVHTSISHSACSIFRRGGLSAQIGLHQILCNRVGSSLIFRAITCGFSEE